MTKQWYLESLGINALHSNGITGNKTNPVIQIVEQGIDTNHEDLLPNINFSMAYDSHNNIDSTFDNISNSHGTAVAGIAAVRGYNGIGIRGVVPFATLTGHVFAYNTIGTTTIKYKWRDITFGI